MERKTLEQFKDELARETLKPTYSGLPRNHNNYAEFNKYCSGIEKAKLQCFALVLFHKQEMKAKNEEIENKTLLLEAATSEIERLNESTESLTLLLHEAMSKIDIFHEIINHENPKGFIMGKDSTSTGFEAYGKMCDGYASRQEDEVISNKSGYAAYSAPHGDCTRLSQGGYTEGQE